MPISSYTNEGIDALMEKINETLKVTEIKMYEDEEIEEKVYIKFQEEKPYTITNVNGIWQIKGEKVEKLFNMTKFEEEEGAMRFARKLKGMGIEDELARLGAKPGDDVEINGFLFTYKN